ncbi:MAG: Cys-tRNA(Pro) deacylase [Candidatus Limiplasma sp.]|nr:Cys-tRNA(Pro) deacylase [Candidatus Limiplasma sp.]
MAKDKTNVMRVLDALKLPYTSHHYLDSGAVSGMEVAAALGQNPEAVFKTLVTQGGTKAYYVFLVPVCRELDLKKAAKCVGEKKVEMIHSKDLLPLTGYVHGGCSPIGMKKAYATAIDRSAADFPTIFFSGGKIGYQVEMSLSGLGKAVRFSLEDLVVE